MKCSHCPKKFKNDGALRRHKLYCAILCGDNTEHLETPTITEMWTLVQTVLRKNRDLEEKFKSLSQKISTGSSKNTPSVWLNKKKTGATPIMEWKNQITVSDEQMKYLLQNKYIEGVFNIFKENLEKEEVFPIQSFKNKIYIFDISRWRPMNPKDMSSLIANTQTKIAGAFIRWQQANQDIVNNERNDTYYKYMIEAFGGSKSKETVERGIIKKLTPFVKIKGL